MASINLTSGAGTQQGFNSLWQVLASQKIAVNTQPISPPDNIKPSYANKKTEPSPPKEKPKFAQQPTKRLEVKSPSKPAYLNTTNNLYQKNSISGSAKNSNNISYAAREKIKTSASSYTASTTKYKETNTTKKTTYAAQPSERDTHIAKSAQAQAKLLQRNQDTQNGNKDYLGTQIDLSA